MAITFNDDQAAALLSPLGLPVDTVDPAAVIATVVDVAGADALSAAAPSAIVAAAESAGLEVLDSEAAAALRADAAEGRRIKAAVERERIENTVNDAIAQGKITPARKDHWVALITADPGMGDVLANVPPETAVPLSEIGHGVDGLNGDQQAREDWFY
ncbi:hypothetical protein GR927_35955 [Mycolicibacterium sp. 3033]|nr:hypothetical protein [Mycolicibacterium aurantiacum]